MESIDMRIQKNIVNHRYSKFIIIPLQIFGILNNKREVKIIIYQNTSNMFVFTSIKKDQSLLSIYTLKHCYEESKQIEKQKNEKYVTNCLIIRKENQKNLTDFGYKQQVKTNILKKINFVYLPTLQDLIAFLWCQNQCPQLKFGMLMIDSIEKYIGESFHYKECGSEMTIILNLLQLISKKTNKKNRVCFSCSYQANSFSEKGFINLMNSYGVIHWQISNKKILKNSQPYQNSYTQNFLKLYSVPDVKIAEIQ